MSDARDILSVMELGVSYGSAPALRGVSLEVRAGEIVGIVGESGSGKSTLLRAVAGLLAPTAAMGGSIRLEGRELAGAQPRELRALRGSAVSYLFQNAERSFDPLFTVGAQFDEVMRAHEGAAANAPAGKAARDGRGRPRGDEHAGARGGQGAREQRRVRQRAALARMGFTDPDRVLAALPSELSGGMAQRVALAFALAGSPRLLLADEPTSALDADAQERVLELLRELNDQEGLAILMVSHDIELVARFASRLIVMHEGRIVETGPSEQVMREPQDPYTRELIAAIPRATGAIEVEQLGARWADRPAAGFQGACASAPTRTDAAARADRSVSKGGPDAPRSR